MVELTNLDIFVIYSMPLIFTLVSWFWESIIDKKSLQKAMLMSTIILAIVNAFSSFIVLGASIVYLSLNIIWWAVVVVTGWILDSKKEDEKSFWTIVLGLGIQILFQFYLVAIEYNILDFSF